jgi:hypothetical protein
MNLANKSFRNNKTGEVVKVIDSFDNLAVLEDKVHADVSKLMNPELYTEVIDPSNFFNNQNAYNSLADKIKSIPADRIKDEPGSGDDISVKFGDSSLKPTTNESAVFMSSEDEEREELAKKYGVINPNRDIEKQNKAFAKLLGEEQEESIQRVDIVREESSGEVKEVKQIETYKPQQVHTPIEDPIITMFKNVKRSKDFSINIEIKNKIPRIDFIEMMEDSYQTSIIDFLAEEFTNNLLKNPQLIENTIKTSLKEMVYGKGETKTVVKKPGEDPKVKKAPVKKAPTKKTPEPLPPIFPQ